MGNKQSTPKDAQAPQAPQPTDTPQVPPPQAQPTINKVEEKAQQAASSVSAQVHKLEDKAKDAAQRLEGKAKEAAHTVKDAAHDAKESLSAKAKEGADAVKKALDTHTAEDKAREVADKAKDAAKDAADSAKQAARSFSSGDIHQYLRDARKLTKSYYKEAKHEFDVINQEGPIAVANFKKNHIFPIDPTTRAVIFYGVTGLSFLVGIKAFGALRAVRNTAFIGAATGFVVYPEAVNPFHRIRREYTEEQEHEHGQE